MHGQKFLKYMFPLRLNHKICNYYICIHYVKNLLQCAHNSKCDVILENIYQQSSMCQSKNQSCHKCCRKVSDEDFAKTITILKTIEDKIEVCVLYLCTKICLNFVFVCVKGSNKEKQFTLYRLAAKVLCRMGYSRYGIKNKRHQLPLGIESYIKTNFPEK